MQTVENQFKPDLDFPNVTIGVITALKEEYSACKEIFDPKHEGSEKSKRATSGSLRCWLCRIESKHGGEHIVAITLLPSMGNNAASIGANILLQHCDQISKVIMCGIAGGVPNPDKAEDHVRLGDIVVSNEKGIIQYDRGKQRSTAHEINDPNPLSGFEFRGTTTRPCNDMLEAVDMIHADEILLGKDDIRDWELVVNSFLETCKNEEWNRPYHTKDRLIDEEGGPSIGHPKDNERRSGYPRVFHGPIGAANIVLADPVKRNMLRDIHGVKAIEMESSGIADSCWVAGIGYLVIRGICDYCNHTKNNVWHFYSALVAAAYCKTVIENLHSFALSDRHPGPHLPTSVNDSYLNYNTNLNQSNNSLDYSDHAKKDSLKSKTQDTKPSSISPNQILLDLEIDLSNSETNEKTETQSASQHTDISTIHVQSKLIEEIPSLIETIENLTDELRWSEISPFVNELEKRLKVPAVDKMLLKKGLILLIKIEQHELLQKKQSGEHPDMKRFQRLMKELNDVTT
tara:strand:- start:6828 stop:8372 length:1545 start_codon:yes stop_codon:yes gene_type:complete